MVAMGGAAMVSETRADISRTDAPPRPQAGTRRGRRFAAAWLAGFLVVVGGSELAVRAVASRLDEPLDYFSKPAQLMVHDMNVLQAHHIRSDLTFVGTSMVRRDIDANRLEAGGNGTVRLARVRWAHDVALPGAQTTVVERWLLQEVVPRLHP